MLTTTPTGQPVNAHVARGGAEILLTSARAAVRTETQADGPRMIYLDYNATTPVKPEVLDAMLPFLREEWGNPSSSYRFGSKLKGVIEEARSRVSELIGASPRKIIL